MTNRYEKAYHMVRKSVPDYGPTLYAKPYKGMYAKPYKFTKEEHMDNIGKKVIVRANGAGVFYGTLAEKDGDEVVLENARKLWCWEGACAVEQIAKDGVAVPGKCQFTVTVESIGIMNVLQIIPCTEKASACIEAVKEWKR